MFNGEPSKPLEWGEALTSHKSSGPNSTDASKSTRFTDCRPLFLVGASRSGTTLLQMMLNAHPEVAICGELQYFTQVAPLRRLVPSLSGVDAMERFFSLVRRTNAMKHIPAADTLLREVKARLTADEAPTYEKFYKFVLDVYREMEGAKRVGDKTPESIRYLPELLAIFPNAEIIHIVRDPRDVVTSVRKTWWASDDVMVNALRWRCDVECGREFARGRGQVLTVRYEDLVQKPERLLNKVCDFIHETYSSRMLSFYETSRKYIREEPWKEGTFRPVYNSSIGNWRGQLSEPQTLMIEKISGNALRHFGYTRSEFRLRSRLLVPLAAVLEIFKYMRHKFTEAKMRRNERREIIFGERKTLYRLALRLVFGMRP